MNNRANHLRLAIQAFDRGDLMGAADILEKSDLAIDRENAVNCRTLARGADSHMIGALGYLLSQHLEMAEMFE